jgi:hypothetical protein
MFFVIALIAVLLGFGGGHRDVGERWLDARRAGVVGLAIGRARPSDRWRRAQRAAVAARSGSWYARPPRDSISVSSSRSTSTTPSSLLEEGAHDDAPNDVGSPRNRGDGGRRATRARADAARIMHAAEARVATPGGMQRLVAAEDVQSSAAGVSGKLVNRSNDTLLTVRLMVTDQFQWTQKRQPGVNDPGGEGQITVAGPIPPGASVPFHIQRTQLLPTRSDGTFKTDVSVLGVTR